MSHAVDSKSAAAHLIDPMNAPEPAAETGLNSHFGSTFAKSSEINGVDTAPTSSPSSNNPYRKESLRQERREPLTQDRRAPPSQDRREPPMQDRTESLRHGTPQKTSVSTTVRAASGSPPQKFPNYRAEAFGDFEPAPRQRAGSHGQHTPPSYNEATSSGSAPGRRRGSSLKERYPGDKSGEPLDIIRRDSRKAYRSHHLKKTSLPGADQIDRLDPAIGGRSYHHEGPYDAALLARNRDPKTAPLAALEDSNAEALKATPKENIKDAVEHHHPLDGTAYIPPGMPDQFGRTYNYQEGADLMHEGTSDAGYKRWPGKDYDPEDLKGESEPAFSLDRALRTHNINDEGIEMKDRAHINKDYHEAERKGLLDNRDPMEIAGGQSKYIDMEAANAEEGELGETSATKHHSGLESLKKRIGSLKHRHRDD